MRCRFSNDIPNAMLVLGLLVVPVLSGTQSAAQSTSGAGTVEEEGTYIHVDIGSTNVPQALPADERSFDIGRNRITVGQFKTFMSDTGYVTLSERNYGHMTKETTWESNPVAVDPTSPVVLITWFDAVEYCAWLSRKTGYLHRLPTEEELVIASASTTPIVTDSSTVKLFEFAFANKPGDKGYITLDECRYLFCSSSAAERAFLQMAGSLITQPVLLWGVGENSSDIFNTCASMNGQTGFRVVREKDRISASVKDPKSEDSRVMLDTLRDRLRKGDAYAIKITTIVERQRGNTGEHLYQFFRIGKKGAGFHFEASTEDGDDIIRVASDNRILTTRKKSKDKYALTEGAVSIPDLIREHASGPRGLVVDLFAVCFEPIPFQSYIDRALSVERGDAGQIRITTNVAVYEIQPSSDSPLGFAKAVVTPLHTLEDWKITVRAEVETSEQQASTVLADEQFSTKAPELGQQTKPKSLIVPIP